ncbi:hypothetical protein HT136_11125 [Novosphingobium profundi]|uniref:hypothetical protein n=1 Tax=Novosphingobium profundi TaxID=1774954 RepID=UPI001BD99D78|nr:hypothetical protein [Novosphingobium profundi]MBT0668919.1 hypothetical protein [Novosphingobium profundi]
MVKHADAILKLSLAAAALMAGAGVGFYYGIYLPAQDIRAQSQAMTEHVDVVRQQSDALAEKARREKIAQNAYADCVSGAELTYKNHWTAACRAQSAADEAAYEDCADDWFSTEAGCRRKHPIRPERGCALTTRMAERLVEERRDARRQCDAALQAAQQS